MFTKFFPLIFPAPVLEQVRQRLAVADKQVIDETITGFTYAMQAVGYTPSLHPAGCLILSECQNCKSSYATRYEMKHHFYFACPHCQTITKGIFKAAIWNQREENRLLTTKGEEFWHSEGRTVYDRKHRQSYEVDEWGNLTQDDIPDYVLGRIDTAQLEDAERRRLAWIESAD
ncbi:hypothetical protein AAE416_005044 [Escherichia coli]|nr:hypothetical protein [Salmonella enterica subsp. enterica serovar Enteritidis]EGE9946430.1 hypothetical protein [Salmonella enterica]